MHETRGVQRMVISLLLGVAVLAIPEEVLQSVIARPLALLLFAAAWLGKLHATQATGLIGAVLRYFKT